MKANTNIGTVGNIIGTAKGGILTFHSVSAAVAIVTGKIDEAIENQKHSTSGDYPEYLNVQFRGETDVLSIPKEVYLNIESGKVRGGNSKAIREWIHENAPESMREKGRYYVAMWSSVEQVWGAESSP